jgi:Zn-dependent M16 (insulinase) family peptidase
MVAITFEEIMSKFFVTRHTSSEVQVIVGPDSDLTEFLGEHENEELVSDAEKVLSDADIDTEDIMENTLGIEEFQQQPAEEALLAAGWTKGTINESLIDDDEDEDGDDYDNFDDGNDDEDDEEDDDDNFDD